MKRSSGGQCKVDDFELIMDHFEKTALQQQPFLSMDVSNIMSYEEIEPTFEGVINEKLRVFAKHIYLHWKDQKIAREGRTIIPFLKVGYHASLFGLFFSLLITCTVRTRE